MYRRLVPTVVTLPRRLRNWLLHPTADPSVRLRVLRDVLDEPADDPQVAVALRQIGRKGWAAQMLRLQHPGGQWDTAGSSAGELYRPKYVATNWRLLVLSDLGVTKKNLRVAKAVRLFLRRFSGPTGGLGSRGSEVCFTGNAARMLVRFGYLETPQLKPPSSGWCVIRSRTEAGTVFRPERGPSIAGKPWPRSRPCHIPPGPLRSREPSSGGRNSTSTAASSAKAGRRMHRG